MNVELIFKGLVTTTIPSFVSEAKENELARNYFRQWSSLINEISLLSAYCAQCIVAQR